MGKGVMVMISASLVLYKTKIDDLATVLQCVDNSCIDIIYLIDNSPSDDLQNHLIEMLNTKVEYIYIHGNIGFGSGNNIGIHKAFEAQACYHIVLNPDIVFAPEVIVKLTEFMNKNPKVGQILPRVIYPDGSLQFLCKLLPTPLDIFGRRFLPHKWIKDRNDRYEMHFTGYDKIWNCPILSGCFMFLRVSTLKDIGLFDERFFMYFEDFDLMRRIHQKYQTIYFPYVTIIHNHAAEHRINKRLLLESMKSAIKYFNKWGWFYDRQRKLINKRAISEVANM